MKAHHTPIPPGTKVRFADPQSPDEESAVMTVIEDRDDRVLVCDDSLAHWPIPPQACYFKTDLCPLTP